MNKDNIRIAIIGLGYVGLPLAIEFGKKFLVIGFDINEKRIKELKARYDRTLEISSEEFLESTNLTFSSSIDDIESANYFIITVPTPIDKYNKPDLLPLLSASKLVASKLKKGDIVIYESTVYPGCTEEDCVPVLEIISGLKYNSDFFCGYSPERINPGDKEHRLTQIKKITSGSDEITASKVDNLYSSIIKAGTYKAHSIKVAEAAKVIENAQRDINIAFVNELAMIFNRLNIDTQEVLKASSTKWNFLPFKPGLVGGHCIGVDPFYLTQKAQEVGYHPEIILAGRRINDGMGAYIASSVVKLMNRNGLVVNGSKILVLGITFKENCPDIRNSRVIDIIEELKDFGAEIDVYDPWSDKLEVEKEYSITTLEKVDFINYSCIILAVAHSQFLEMDFSILKDNKTILYDVKSILPKGLANARL
jgi:UDP-N-acetyl-D-galactosamine dehydrogenase